MLRYFLYALLFFYSANVAAQQRIAGRYLPQYRLFIPEDTARYFVKRFTCELSVYAEKKDMRIDDGLLKLEKCGLVDTNGTVVIAPVYERIRVSNDSIFIVKLDNKEGLVDNKGKVVLAPSYDYIGFFNKGYAVVGDNRRYGYIDKNGKQYIPLDYDLTFDYYNGFFHVMRNKKQGLLDSNRKVIFEPISQNIRPYGRFITMRLNDKDGLFDKQGNRLLDNVYDELSEVNDDSIIAVHSDGESWLMNIYTKAQLSKKYRQIYTFGSLDSSNLCRAFKGYKEALISKQDVMMTERYYDNIGIFYEGRASVELANKFGLIDEQGRLAVPLIYDKVWRYKEGACMMILNGKKGFIDANGKLLFYTEYDNTSFFENGFATIARDGKTGFINRQGKLVIPRKFDWTEHFKEHAALVAASNDFYYINEKGERIK